MSVGAPAPPLNPFFPSNLKFRSHSALLVSVEGEARGYVGWYVKVIANLVGLGGCLAGAGGTCSPGKARGGLCRGLWPFSVMAGGRPGGCFIILLGWGAACFLRSVWAGLSGAGGCREGPGRQCYLGGTGGLACELWWVLRPDVGVYPLVWGRVGVDAGGA